MVHIQDLSLAFGEQVLFEHLDLTLLPNEWVSLLGCSGVGKSTLLRLIAGLDIQGKIQGNIIPIKSGLRRLSFIFFPLITRSIIAVGASTNCFGLDLVVLYLQVL